METIIKLLQQAVKESGLKVSDKSIFESAIKIYISQSIQKGYKDTDNQKIMPPEPSKSEFKGNKASEPQIKLLKRFWESEDGGKYLKSIGFDGNFDVLTKKQAFEYISRVKKEQEESQNEY